MIKLLFGKNYSKSITMENNNFDIVKEILSEEDWKVFQKSFKYGFKIKIEHI